MTATQPWAARDRRRRARSQARAVSLQACAVAAAAWLSTPVAAPVAAEAAPTASHRLQQSADNVDLCGDSCEKIATSGNQALEERIRRRRNCRATWGGGCPTAPPPRGFSASSTLWEMCPHACPSDIRPGDHTPPPPPPPPPVASPPVAPPPPPPSPPLPPPPGVPTPDATQPVDAPTPPASSQPNPPPATAPSPPPAPVGSGSQPGTAARPAVATSAPGSQQVRTGAPKRGPDAGALRVEIRTKILGAAYDFLYAMCLASLSIIGAVFFCRRRKRQLKRMGMSTGSGSHSNHRRKMKIGGGEGGAGGPRPPPWPPGRRSGVARGLSKLSNSVRRKQRVTIAEEVPLYSIAEDYGSSSDDDGDDVPYAPAVNANANANAGRYGMLSGGHGHGGGRDVVPTVVVTDRAQVRAHATPSHTAL